MCYVNVNAAQVTSDFYFLGMEMNKTTRRRNGVTRYLLGYVLGATVFLLFVPYVIWYMSLLDYPVFRIPVVPEDLNIMIAGPIFFIGMTFTVWSNIYLLAIGKGGPMDIGVISVSPRTVKLVTEGPYRYSRNPMVFGVHSIYLSITIYCNSLGSLMVLAAFFFVIVKYVIVAEEKRLKTDFGDDYLRYKRATSMIIPFPSINTADDG